MNKVADILERVLGWLTVILMAALVLDVVWQVLTRYVLPKPSNFTEETARFLLIWMVFLGGASATRRGAHLSLDLITEKLPTTFARWAINGSIFLFSAAVFVIGGGRLVQVVLQLGQRSPALDIPMGYVYLVVPISGLCICWFALCNLLAPTGDACSPATAAPVATADAKGGSASC